MEEMEAEKREREKQEKENAAKAEKISAEFRPVDTQWEKDKEALAVAEGRTPLKVPQKDSESKQSSKDGSKKEEDKKPVRKEGVRRIPVEETKDQWPRIKSEKAEKPKKPVSHFQAELSGFEINGGD
jgi:hypothetical protein